MEAGTEDLLLHLRVLDGEKMVFEGEIESLSSVNEKGEFDVLERHANFITLIKEKLVLRPKGKEVVEIPLDKGIMKVNEDQVTVFVGMNVLLEEVKSGEEIEGEVVDEKKGNLE